MAVTHRSDPDQVRADVRAVLDEARLRTLALLEPLPAARLRRQHNVLMSPLVWDLAHIGHFEELWLLRELGGEDASREEFDDIYDAFAHARDERDALAMLEPAEAFGFVAEVRRRVLERLARERFDPDDRLARDGFVHHMVVQHEQQHGETMLAAIQLDPEGEFCWEQLPLPPGEAMDGMVDVPGGPFTVGTTDEAWAYDNERPPSTVELAPYRIDVAPVSNGAFMRFMAAGGYAERRFWTDAGWAWLREACVECPGSWRRDGGGWARRRFGIDEPVPEDEPVQHVCWYEADAFARWAGKRLPTEAEWERAAHGADSGHANLWSGAAGPFRPAPVGAYPGGQSEVGCHQMLGDVWEWTSSPFAAYPRFEAFPYREYSEVFFGDEYRVLRGGSWATHRVMGRQSFRNWDYPIRRQIFAGFRCAADA
jgi:iron(II)-dependent oxidoreductase